MTDILNSNNLLTNLKILKIKNKSNFTPNKLNPNQKPALDFLQGQLTIDINNLEDNKLSLAAHCNPKGRVESLFYILKTQDNYYLIMPEDIIDHAKNKLMFFGKFSPITFEIISPEINLIINNKNNKNIYPITNSKILNISLEINWETNSHDLISKENVDKNSNKNPDKNANKNANNLWQYHQLINNTPYLNKQTIGKYLPHELGLTKLDSTIDFKKGCFTGQEVIARMHYLGKAKKEIKFINFQSNKKISQEDLYEIHGEKIQEKSQEKSQENTGEKINNIGEIICITNNNKTNNYLAMVLINKSNIDKLNNLDSINTYKIANKIAEEYDLIPSQIT
jgi:folate-binding protein YgfZ